MNNYNFWIYITFCDNDFAQELDLLGSLLVKLLSNNNSYKVSDKIKDYISKSESFKDTIINLMAQFSCLNNFLNSLNSNLNSIDNSNITKEPLRIKEYLLEQYTILSDDNSISSRLAWYLEDIGITDTKLTDINSIGYIKDIGNGDMSNLLIHCSENECKYLVF